MKDLKPPLLYYVHAHGAGHLATFQMLYPALKKGFNVLAITTNSAMTTSLRINNGLAVIELPPKYPPNFSAPQHTFSKAFEVTPYAVEPAIRANFLAQVIEQYKPVTFFCHGSPELAIMVRGMGVPVVYMHLLGNVSSDPTQIFAYELADHLIARFPKFIEDPDYAYGTKTFYSGFISRYANSSNNDTSQTSKVVSIVMGYDNYSEKMLQNITADKSREFIIIGNKRTYKLDNNCHQLGIVSDISTAIRSDIVVTAAGQNTLAELISLGKRLILLPEPRPYDEQRANATALARNKLALVADPLFTINDWINIMEQAGSFAPSYASLVNKSAPANITQKLLEWYA